MVNLVEGGQRFIENLQVGDRIWSLSPDGQTLIPDEIIMMMHNGPKHPSIYIYIYNHVSDISSIVSFHLPSH